MSQDKAENKKVGLGAYLSLVFALVFFSGIFSKTSSWLRALDFSVLIGKFGSIVTEPRVITFTGVGGSGARAGFLTAVNVLPSVMLAFGVVTIVEHFGALEAARKLLTPLLKPLLGLPGSAGVALVASLQNTDAGAGMTKLLHDTGEINDSQRSIFAAFQFSAGASIINYFTVAPTIFTLTYADKTEAITISMITPLIVMLIIKTLGANVMRIYLKRKTKTKSIAA